MVEAVSKLGAELDEDDRFSLKQQVGAQRWSAPQHRHDPANVLPEQRGPRRLDDIVAHVEASIAVVKRGRAKRDGDALAKERFQEAYRLVNMAKDADLAEQRRDFEAAHPSPGLGVTFNPRPFDKHAWMRGRILDDGTPMLDAYQYMDPQQRFVPAHPGSRDLGGGLQATGGREEPVEQVPADQLQPVGTEA